MAGSIDIVELRGAPHERGLTYGRAAARQINAAYDYYGKRWKMSAEALSAKVRSFLPVLEEFDAAMIEELRGVAAGASRTFEEILAINARNELLFGTDDGHEGCTVIAAAPPATADGHVYIAQNWDWTPELASTSLLLKIIADDAPAILTFVDAGRLAMHGLNECGLGLCGNYLETRAHPNRHGVPISFLRRRILQCDSVAEAASVIETTRRSTSSNYLMADRAGLVMDCETTPEAVYRLGVEDALVVHTNHFCHPDAPAEDHGLARVPDSSPRAERAAALLRRKRGRIDAAALKTVLADHEGHPASICRHGDSGPNWSTLASHVMDLKHRTIELAIGPPCRSDYQTFQL